MADFRGGKAFTASDEPKFKNRKNFARRRI
jgi:hypothetical protein